MARKNLFMLAVIFSYCTPTYAQNNDIDEIVNSVCPTETAYKNLADVAIIRERTGEHFATIAPYCLAYNEGWLAGWEARETRSVAENYNSVCRELLLKEIRGEAGALERYASSISNGFAQLAFLDHCQTYKEGLQAGMELSRSLLNQ